MKEIIVDQDVQSAAIGIPFPEDSSQHLPRKSCRRDGPRPRRPWTSADLETKAQLELDEQQESQLELLEQNEVAQLQVGQEERQEQQGDLKRKCTTQDQDRHGLTKNMGEGLT